jgi:hypothetical protein
MSTMYFIHYILSNMFRPLLPSGLTAGEGSVQGSAWRRVVVVPVRDVSNDRKVFIVFWQLLTLECEGTLLCIIYLCYVIIHNIRSLI